MQPLKLSIRYIADRYLPDKAIDLIDEASAKFHLQTVYAQSDRTQEYEKEREDLYEQKEQALIAGDLERVRELLAAEKKLEKKIEKELMEFLNDMLDFFLIIDNSFKPTLNKDVENEIKKYLTMKEDINNKITRIKTAFIDAIIDANIFQEELNELQRELENVEIKLNELEETKRNIEYKQDIETIFNIKEIEKMKMKSEYVKSHNLWKKLDSSQKYYIINKYIDEIKIDIDKKYNVSINDIIFNKNEIENIGYMFRSDCFDMIINIDERDAILSNYKNEFKTQEYIESLREFYNIKETTIQADLFNINEYDKDNIIQIIPQERKTKFEKNKFTILEIEV